MPKSEQILETMKGKTVTHGWDAIVLHDSARINRLLEEQYITSFLKNPNFQAIPDQDLEIPGGKILLRGLKLGAPWMEKELASENSEISEQNTAIRSTATFAMNFIAGRVITLDSDGNPISNSDMSPQQNYKLQFKLDLSNAQGSVDRSEILLKLNKAVVQHTNLTQKLSSQVESYLQEWLNRKDHQPYLLSKLAIAAEDPGNPLLPTSFAIRMQAAPKEKGTGALALFVQTQCTQDVGDIPLNYPYYLSADHSSTVIIRSQTLFSHILSPLLMERLAANSHNQALESTIVNAEDKAQAARFELTAGEYKLDNAFLQRTQIQAISHQEWGLYSGHAKNYQNREPLRLPYISTTNYKVAPNKENQLERTWQVDYQAPFTAYSSSDLDTSQHQDTDIELTFIANTQWQPTIDSQYNHLSFKHVKQHTVTSISTPTPQTFKGPWEWSVYGQKSLENQITSSIQDAASQVTADIQLPDINSFYLNHLLFPEENIMELKSAHLPGDLVAFGDINPKLTSLKIFPVQAIAAVKQSQLFQLTPAASDLANSVSWEVIPAGIGEIRPRKDDPYMADYTAPETLDISAAAVRITATSGDKQASALCMIAPSSIALTPSLSFIQRAQEEAIAFKATLVSGSEALQWSLSPAKDHGTLNSDGQYTPPSSDAFPDGFKVVTVTAKMPNGNWAEGHVCLIHEAANHEFTLEPAYLPQALKPEETYTFSIPKNRSFKPELWKVFPPERGTIQYEGFNEEEKKHQATYTAPKNIEQPLVAVIKATAQDDAGENPDRYGYALVSLKPSALLQSHGFFGQSPTSLTNTQSLEASPLSYHL